MCLLLNKYNLIRDKYFVILSVERMVKHMSYGRRVQALTLLGEGLSKSEVARRLGVHRSTLWRLEQFRVKDPIKVRITRMNRTQMLL